MSTVQSVDRALTILDLLAREGESGVTELAGALGVHKSTASRLLESLAERDLVEQPDQRGRFRLGAGVLRLAAATTARLDVVQEARSLAKVLAAQTGETINIAVLDDGAALYVDQVVAASAATSSHNWVGQRIPLHATSNGKVLLAGLDAREARAVLGVGPGEELAHYTDHTVTDVETLLGQLTTTHAQGHSVVSDELELGLTAVAAPIHNVHGDVVASLSASGPSFRLAGAALDEAVVAVSQAAAEVSERLGWRGGVRADRSTAKTC